MAQNYANYSENALIALLTTFETNVLEFTGVTGKEAALTAAQKKVDLISAEIESRGKGGINAAVPTTNFNTRRKFSHIRIREPETYKLLVREMDGVYTPADLSKAAKLYTDRLDKTDPAANSGAYLNTNRGGKPPQDSNTRTECFQWRDKGRCYRGDSCKYFHDARHKKKETEDKPPREDSRQRKSKKYNRGSGSRGSSTSNQGGANVTQPADANATSNFNQVSREVFHCP